jgi:DNA-binding CsgD family transcriptional regulator
MGLVSQDYWDELETLAEATSIRTLDQCFRRVVEPWGFSRWTAMQIAGARRGPVEPFDQALGKSSAEWTEHYRDNKYYEVDAVLQLLKDSDDPVWWSEMANAPGLSPTQRRIFLEAREFGLQEGLTAPVSFVNGSVWICAITGSDAQPASDVRFAAHQAMNVYIRRARQIRRPDAPSKEKDLLTRQQIRIVALMARGANAKAAAEQLGIKAKTVYHQIQFAKQRLQVRTATELVARAWELGLIGTDDT